MSAPSSPEAPLRSMTPPTASDLSDADMRVAGAGANKENSALAVRVVAPRPPKQRVPLEYQDTAH